MKGLAKICRLPHEPEKIRIRAVSSQLTWPQAACFSLSAAVSHGQGLTFFGFSRIRLGIDAEAPFAISQEMAIRRFYERIWPEFGTHGHFSRSQLARIWTICEALLKFVGTGWDCNSARILKPVTYWQRKGSIFHANRWIFWQTWPLRGHWFCAAAHDLRQIEFQIS